MVNWEALGALGELFGAVAVVATLFYLGQQIRQNSASLDRANDYAQARSVHEINNLYVEVFAPLSQDGELADIYDRAVSGEALSRVEPIRFGAFINTFLAWQENTYYQHQHDLGFMTENIASIETISGPYMRKLLNTEAGQTWWRSEGVHLYTREYQAVIEKALLNPGEEPPV